MIFGLTKFDINVASFISSFTPCYFLPLKLFFSNWTAGGFLNVPTCLLSSLLSFSLLAYSAHPSHLKPEGFYERMPIPSQHEVPALHSVFLLATLYYKWTFWCLPPVVLYNDFWFLILPSLVQSFEGGLIL